MKRLFVIMAGALTLASCSQMANPTASTPQPSAERFKILGTVEIRVVADPLNPSSTAQFFPVAEALSAQGKSPISAIPLTLTRLDTTVLDQQNDLISPKLRYVSSAYKITNTTANDWENLYFVALSDANAATPSVGQSALHSLLAASGANLDSTPSIAQNMRPSHSMVRGANGTFQVDNNYADLQLFTEAETSDIQTLTSLNGTNQFLLPYGFSAHNLTNQRQIEKQSCITTGCNQGLVAFAYHFPRTAPSASATPYAYTIRYQAVVDMVSRISQSPEETDSNLAIRIGALTPAPTVVAVYSASSGYSGSGELDVDQVRVSGTSSLPITLLFPLCC